MDTVSIVLLVLLVLSVALHAIAPRTKTKADDVAAEVVDAVRGSVTDKYKPKQ